MIEIHCHNCGGFITDPGTVSYQAPSAAAAAAPHSALCACIPSVVYGPPPAYLAWPGLASFSSFERSRAAARN
jgi:hypothetical protein